MSTIYTLPDGRDLVSGIAFECGGIAYPANFFDCASSGDLASHGITSRAGVVVDQVPIGLDRLKANLVADVQIGFEDACAKVVTPGSAMANVYRVQVDAAYRLIAGAITTHPSLAALVGILAPNELGVATIIKSRNEACETDLSRLNAKRFAAKNAILNAGDEASARAAANVDW